MVGTADRWAGPKVDRTEGRWVDPKVDRTEGRWAGQKVDRKEGRWSDLRVDRMEGRSVGRSVGPTVDRTEGRWADPRVVQMADRWVGQKVDRSVGPRVDRTGDLKEDRWGVGSVALTGRTEATSPEWMEQQAASMPVPQQALGLQASRVQEAGRRRAPVPRPQAMSALPAA